VIQSFVIFIPFGVGDKAQFQIPARSQILPLCGIFDDPEDNANDKTYSPIFSLSVDRH
jgi:hypothetical protein